MRHFISPDGEQFTRLGGTLLEPPEGWTEVDEAEFEARLAERVQVGEERAVAWIAQQPTLPDLLRSLEARILRQPGGL